MLPQSTLPLRAAAFSLRLAPTTFTAPAIHRHAYSSATSTPDTTTTATPTDHVKLDWDSFLNLRKSRRRYNLVSSIFGSMLGTSGGVGYLANKEIDLSQLIMGMDPLMMFGVATLSCGTIGWLAGPVLGTRAFAFMNAKHMPQIEEREREFLQHIKKNRVDPSFQSFSNPAPDYYGEKIGSVKQYRQWLKDQRAYNRKSETFL